MRQKSKVSMTGVSVSLKQWIAENIAGKHDTVVLQFVAVC